MLIVSYGCGCMAEERDGVFVVTQLCRFHKDAVDGKPLELPVG